MARCLRRETRRAVSRKPLGRSVSGAVHSSGESARQGCGSSSGPKLALYAAWEPMAPRDLAPAAKALVAVVAVELLAAPVVAAESR